MNFENKSTNTCSYILTRIILPNEVSVFAKSTEKKTFEDCRYKKFTTVTILFLELGCM